MLDTLIAAFPEPAWDLNSRLQITAHSRAADLRRLGYGVEHVSRSIEGRRKLQHGYKLTTQPVDAPVYITPDGQQSFLPAPAAESVAS
jgi:hypothetical protein